MIDGIEIKGKRIIIPFHFLKKDTTAAAQQAHGNKNDEASNM